MPGDNARQRGFVAEPPSPAAQARLFEGGWASALPGVESGANDLFADARIAWLADQIGGFAGKTVLELGPLEGAHTCMMARAGAAVTAIEANKTAFLKCLVVQNMFKFAADFQLGDFRPYLAKTSARFDLVTMIGVLYHMTDPLALVRDAARATDQLAIWTHYYDPARPPLSGRFFGRRFSRKPIVQHEGALALELYRHDYEALNWKRFRGGAAPYSYWMTRQGLLDFLDALGFAVVLGAESDQETSGPSLMLLARRRGT